jgi:uncharacterized protein YggE
MRHLATPLRAGAAIEKPALRWLLVPLVALLAACGTEAITTVPVHAVVNVPATPRQIKVNGIATLEVNPNVVDVTLTLEVQGPRPKEAVAGLESKRKTLVPALRSAGVSADELRLSHVNVTPVHKRHPDSHVIDGYRASITLVATLKDFSRIGDLMDTAAAHEVSRMHTHFRSTKMAEMKVRVREMALQAARSKANQVATSMKVALGDLLAVEELARDTPSWGALSNANAFAPAQSSDAPLQPGALPITLTVVVTYGLAD